MITYVDTAAKAARRRIEYRRGIIEDVSDPNFRIILHREIKWQLAWLRSHIEPTVELLELFMLMAGESAADLWVRRPVQEEAT